MSVRLRTWKDATGRTKSAWLVDVVFEHADGSEQRVKKFSPVSTRRGAEEYERQIRAQLLAGTYGVARGVVPTLAEFAPRFLEHADTNNKKSSARAKRQILDDHLAPAFGTWRLNQIGAGDVETFKAGRLRAGLAAKTINNILTVLGRLLGLAEEWDVIKRAPKIVWLRAGRPDFDFLTFDEAPRLVAGADSEWVPMIQLVLNTGLRQGELLALRWDCVGPLALQVRRAVWRGKEGTPKGGRSREVELNDTARRALASLPGGRTGYVFGGATPGQCKWPLYRACSTAGLRRIGWHVLRHTFASHLVMRGVPLKAVQELLGHATIEMTMRYAHLSPAVRMDAVRTLDTAGGTAH